jgi:hypothetical protein
MTILISFLRFSGVVDKSLVVVRRRGVMKIG